MSLLASRKSKLASTQEPSGVSAGSAQIKTRVRKKSSKSGTSQKYEAARPDELYSVWGTKRKPKMSKRELVHLTSQLAIMTRSGVDVASAISALANQSRNPDSKYILTSIHCDVIAGETFSAALSRFEYVFGASYVASVTAGEASGRMWEVLDQLARLQRGSMKLRNTLKTMAAYPVALLLISFAVIVALLVFVLPQFADIFKRYDAELPWATQVLIYMSDELIYRFWLWIPTMAIAGLGILAFSRTTTGIQLKDRFMLSFPVVGNITQCLYIGGVCRLLGLLLQSGVPLLESLKLVRKSVKNVHYNQIIADVIDNVLNGEGLGNTLVESTLVPPSASEMILTAEQTGSLGDASVLIGEHFEDEGEEKLRGAIAILEPAVTVLMGAIVAFVVLAVALPMFDLSAAVSNE